MNDAAARAPRRFRKALKVTLYTLSAVVLTLIAVVVYIAATFDPRVLNPRAIDLVREKTGRTLEIRGETVLSFWPDVGVSLAALTLSERGRADTFATVEAARVTLKLVPLLKGEIVATELVVKGANVRVTRDEKGRLNIADLFEGEGGPPRFDIGRVAIERSTLTYRDLAGGTRYELGAVALETGRLAPGVVTQLSLGFVAADETGSFSMQVKLKTQLDLDYAAPRYALGATHVEAQGRYGEDTIVATLDAARFSFVPAPAAGEAVRMTLLAKGQAGTTGVKLDMPKVGRDGERVGSPAAALELTLERGEHRVQATIATPFEANMAAREVSLGEIDAGFAAFGPRLPRKGLEGTLKGEAKIDIGKEGVRTGLAGKIGESRVKAQIAAAGFASPVYTFAVELDRLDLDRYAAGESPARKATRTGGAQDLLEVLEGLPASGTLAIGVLESAGTKAKNVKLALR